MAKNLNPFASKVYNPLLKSEAKARRILLRMKIEEERQACASLSSDDPLAQLIADIARRNQENGTV